MKSLICIWIALCFIGCGNSEKKEVLELVKEWNGKEILFPTESFTTVLGKDTFMMEENPEYKVVVYTDSVGCTSCKLQLHRWMELMHEVDSLAKGRVSFLFYFYSERKNESNDIFHRFNFVYPVYWDEKNEFYRLNRFPSDITFQTFLLDKNNKIIAIGNPVHNPKIKDLYNELKNKYQSDRIVFLPFLPPPLHLEITKLAHIGILVYIVNGVPINHAINVLYCAPNKLYEYSKFGIPMIANDLPALNMVFSQNKAGVCLQTLSAEEISRAILEIDYDYDAYSKASNQLYSSIDMVDLVKTILSDED